MDLRLEKLSKRFGEKLAVAVESLVVRDGEFFTFVGPSGCGKSTLLNLIAGLEAPTTGTLWLGERRLNELAPHQRDVAFVFQHYALYPHRTVFQNIAFPLELAGWGAERKRQRVEEVAARLGLDALLEKYPRQLSGGERQRVALGRAMVREPQLFLFDEPLSNLDAPLRAQMRQVLKRLQRQLGATFIYVTHDQDEALSLSDRIAVMQAGHIQQCGSPQAVYAEPTNVFVASFFGSPAVNLLRARVETEGGAVGLRLGELRVAVAKAAGELRGFTEVTLGIRPEHIRLGRQGRAGSWPGEVTLAEIHGGQAHLEVEAGGVRVTVVESTEANYRVGESVHARFLSEHLLFFDPTSGRRLFERG